MFKILKLYQIIQLAIVCLCTIVSHAQLLPIQDPSMAKAMCGQCSYIMDYSCKYLDTAQACKYRRNSLTFSHNSINSANELMYLKLVDTLNVHSNNISSLPAIGAGTMWKNIDFSSNKLTKFPDLAPLSKTLKTLNLANNSLVELKGLDKLQNIGYLNLSNNKLKYLPEINSATHLESANVSGNYLSFNSLIPLANHLDRDDDNFVLGNQHLLTKDTTLNFYENYQAKLVVPIDSGVPGLTYTWYKGLTVYKTTNTNSLEFSTIQKSDSGEYWVAITSNHPRLLNVVLATGKLIVKVQACQKLLSYEFNKNVNCENSSISLNSIKLSNTNWPFTFAIENENKSLTIIEKGSNYVVASGIYSLLIFDSKGCNVKQEKALVLPVAQSCPSVVSPNGDGIQDVIYLNGQNEAQIINKDGIIVKNISLPNYWDGTNNQGEQVSIGSYIVLRKDGTSEKLTVVR